MVTVTLNLAGAGLFLAGAASLMVAFVVAVLVHDGYCDRKRAEELIWQAKRQGATPDQVRKWRSLRFGTRTTRLLGKPFAAIGWLVGGLK